LLKAAPGRARRASYDGRVPAHPSTVDLRLRLPATPGNVGVARQELAELCASIGLPAAAVGNVKVAASEACTNVVVHAYADDAEPGDFEVEARQEGDDLRVVVRDWGRGMSPRIDSPGLGLGLPLMASLSSRLDVTSGAGDGPTEIAMTFDLRRLGGEPARAARRAP
jgi:anti-sigma regulatory factor (Ser/Thr protein kinase)